MHSFKAKATHFHLRTDWIIMLSYNPLGDSRITYTKDVKRSLYTDLFSKLAKKEHLQTTRTICLEKLD